jgi:hypothetical protein
LFLIIIWWLHDLLNRYFPLALSDKVASSYLDLIFASSTFFLIKLALLSNQLIIYCIKHQKRLQCGSYQQPRNSQFVWIPQLLTWPVQRHGFIVSNGRIAVCWNEMDVDRHSHVLFQGTTPVSGYDKYNKLKIYNII